MTKEQLKAQAYDALANIEFWQKKLNDLNNQIANFKEPEVEVVKQND